MLLCTDGSELATGALATGRRLLGPDAVPVVVTVADVPDPGLLEGGGLGGPVVTPEEFDQHVQRGEAEARAIVDRTVEALGLTGADTYVLSGDPAAAICQLAEDLSAEAIVVGSRGTGRPQACCARLGLRPRRAECPVHRGGHRGPRDPPRSG